MARNSLRRGTLLILGFVMASFSGNSPSMGAATCDPVVDPTCVDDSGVSISASSLINLSAGGSSPNNASSYEFGMSTMCGGINKDEPFHDDNCGLSRTFCAGNLPAAGIGPAVYVFQRLRGDTGDWTFLGHTCWPTLVPGPATPSMAMIEAAFHRTPLRSRKSAFSPWAGGH